MGEKQNGPFQLSFNASLKVDFQGSGVTSDGGLILVRELDERLGFGDLIAKHLTGSRRGSECGTTLNAYVTSRKRRAKLLMRLECAAAIDSTSQNTATRARNIRMK
jgi:hypothetical protein